MPVSRLFTATILSVGILWGYTSMARAQSDLPGCADPQVKDMALQIVVKNLEKHIRGMEPWQARTNGLYWQLDAFSLKYITLVDTNEQTGALTCRATLHGKKDKIYWDDPSELPSWFWEYEDITTMEYTVAESAEDPEFLIVSVVY